MSQPPIGPKRFVPPPMPMPGAMTPPRPTAPPGYPMPGAMPPPHSANLGVMPAPPLSAGQDAATAPMATPVLGYAAPAMGYTGRWRDGKFFVTPRDGRLDDVCVKCGQPTDGYRKTKTYYWHEPWLYILIFFPGLLIYAIVALIVRKKGTLDVGLCPAHRKRRNFGIALTTFLALGGLFIMIAGPIASEGKGSKEWMMVGGVFGGILMIIASVIVGVTMARIVYAKRMNEQYAWYGGAGEGFLSTLGYQR